MAALGVGLFFHVAATVLRTGAHDGSNLVWPADAAALAGAASAILGLTALLCQRLGARAGDVVFEGVVAATAAGFVMWALFTGPSSAGAAPPASGALLRFLLSWVVLWLAARLAWLTDEKPRAFRYLLAAFFVLLSADALAIGTAFGAGATPQGRFPALGVAAFCLWAVGTVHPSLRPRLVPVAEQSDGNPASTTDPQPGVGPAGPCGPGAAGGPGGRARTAGRAAGVGSAAAAGHRAALPPGQGPAGAEHRAQHDALTGLPNRTLFNDRVDMAVAQARRTGSRVAVMYLDLDRFKSINDSLGHGLGNELLKAVARRLTGAVRDSDTVARMGGDEFTLLLPDLTCAADAAEVADKVLRAFADPFPAGTQELFTTTSIGAALFPDDGTDGETLLMHADTAMYRAKADGPNRCQFFTSDMGTRAQVMLSLESSLRHAIERQELDLHYQPKVEIQTRRVVGLEALVRWNHPQLQFAQNRAEDVIGSVLARSGLVRPCSSPGRHRWSRAWPTSSTRCAAMVRSTAPTGGRERAARRAASPAIGLGAAHRIKQWGPVPPRLLAKTRVQGGED